MFDLTGHRRHRLLTLGQERLHDRRLRRSHRPHDPPGAEHRRRSGLADHGRAAGRRAERDYNYNGLNWLSDNFAPFVYANNTSNAVKLPIDTHALIGMIAPRGLLVLENPHQTQMGAPAGHMATIAGPGGLQGARASRRTSATTPPSRTPRTALQTEYTDLLTASIAAFLKHTGDRPGRSRSAPVAPSTRRTGSTGRRPRCREARSRYPDFRDGDSNSGD